MKKLTLAILAIALVALVGCNEATKEGGETVVRDELFPPVGMIHGAIGEAEEDLYPPIKMINDIVENQ